MVYGARHFAAFVTLALAATAAFLGGLRFGLEPRLGDPAAVHAFFFERSPIQWVTLGVFFFTLAILGHRAIVTRRTRRDLAAFGRRQPPRQGFVADRLGTLSGCKQRRGAEAAAALAREVAGEDMEALGRIHGLLHSAIQLMLALGFLGTVWGISRSLFGSFGMLSGAEVGQLRAGIEGFTAALGTALDTSVLGLVCGLTATLLVTASHWAETGVLATVDRAVRHVLGLGASGGESPAAVDRLEEHLANIGAAVAKEASSRIALTVAECVQSCEAKLAASLERHLGRLDAHQGRLFQGIEGLLAQHLAASLRAFDDQSAQLRAAVVAELRDIARGLNRVPEVSIRYPAGAANGAAAPTRQ